MLLGEKLEILISRKQMSKTEFAEKNRHYIQRIGKLSQWFAQAQERST